MNSEYFRRYMFRSGGAPEYQFLDGLGEIWQVQGRRFLEL